MKAVSATAKTRYEHMITLTQRMLHTVLLRIARNTLQNYEQCFSRYLKESPDPQIELILVHAKEGLTFVPSLTQVREGVFDLLRVLQELLTALPQLSAPIVEVDSRSISFEDCIILIDKERVILAKIIDELFQRMDSFLGEYRHLEKLLKLDPELSAAEFDPKGERTLQEYRNCLEEFQEFLGVIQTQMPTISPHSLFTVSCAEFKEKSTTHFQTLMYNFLTQNKALAMGAISELNQQFSSIACELKKVPKTPEELAALKK
jgi:hypothetical protein